MLLLGLLLLQDRLDSHFLELLCNLTQHSVDANVRLLEEGFLAHGAHEEGTGLPVASKAGHAEVVATGDGHWIGEDIQADGTMDLLFCEHVCR